MRLTPAQTRLVVALAQGKTSEQIAREQGRSRSGVQSSLSDLYNRMGAVNAANAVYLWIASFAREGECAESVEVIS